MAPLKEVESDDKDISLKQLKEKLLFTRLNIHLIKLMQENQPLSLLYQTLEYSIYSS